MNSLDLVPPSITVNSPTFEPEVEARLEYHKYARANITYGHYPMRYGKEQVRRKKYNTGLGVKFTPFLYKVLTQYPTQNAENGTRISGVVHTSLCGQSVGRKACW